MKKRIGVAISLFVAVSAWAQEGVPKSSDETLDRLGALVERNQRAGTAKDGPNGYDLLIEAIAAVKEADLVWRQPDGKVKPGMESPVFDAIYRQEGQEPSAAAKTAALNAMRSYHDAGVFKLTAKLPGAMRAARPRYDSEQSRRNIEISDGGNSDEKWDGRLLTMLLPDLGKSRNLVRIEMARMQQAVDAGDATAAAAAFEESFAIGRILSHQSTLIDRLVGIAALNLAVTEAKEAIGAGKATTAMLSAWESAMERQLPLAPVSLAVEGERLSVMDTIRWAYEGDDLSAAKMTEVQSLAGGDAAKDYTKLGGSLATRAESTKNANGLFDKFARYASTPRTGRGGLGFEPDKLVEELPSGEILLRVMVPNIRRLMMSDDQLQMQLAAVRAMIALERHKAAKGEYPATLADLGAATAAKLIDPFSGKTLGYKLLDAKGANANAGYLLYSAGVDGTDNGGKQSDDPYAAMSSKPEGKGLDFLLSGPAAK
ncbi:MAG: hypothetical protein ACOYN0_11080 [Phycisphaerales bacterium]